MSRRTFRDVDAFREHIQGWDTEVTQLERRFWLGWEQIALDDLVVARLRVGGACVDVSTIEPGWKCFVVALAPGLRTCGLEVDHGSLIVMRSGREHRSRVPAGWQSLEIVVADPLVEQLGLLTRAGLPSDLPPEQSVLRLDPVQVDAFGALASHLPTPPSAAPPAVVHGMVADAVRARIVALLTSALQRPAAGRSGMAPLRRVPRYELAIRALDVMEQNRDEPPTLGEIATALGTTPRAIQYAFQTALGVSPYRYLLARRLHAVRRDLRVHSRGRAPVTATAFEHGFADLSRFAQHYQRLFGEPPSATLRRARTMLRVA